MRRNAAIYFLLECLPVDGAQALVLVLPLGDPHLLEGVQGGENRAADPRGVKALLRRTNPDLDVLGGQLLHLGEQPVAESLEECRAAGEDNVLEENLEIRRRSLYLQKQICGNRNFLYHVAIPVLFATT